MQDQVDVCIVGGGVAGLSCALKFSHAGLKVRVIDKLFSGSSRNNIGEVIRYGYKPAELPLHDYSLKSWQEVKEVYDNDFGFESRGSVTFALDDKASTLLKKEAEELETVTFYENGDDLQEALDENTRISEDVLGANVNPEAGVVETARTMDQLRQAVVRKNVLVWGSDEVDQFLVKEGKICGVRTTGGDDCFAKHIVITAGVWSGRILTKGNMKLPIRPARCHLLQFTPSGHLPDKVFVLRGAIGDIYVKYVPVLGRAIVSYTGMMDQDQATWSTDIDPGAIEMIQERLTHMLPALGQAHVAQSTVVSLAVTPDGLPFIGAVPDQPNVLVATGFHGKSFALAPGVAKVLTSLVKEEDPEVDISPFSLDRFAKKPTA